jgi:molybdenum cofactor cytidylyltransferase
MNSCGLVLLAAGASNRMGQPKQLLMYKGRTLLEYTLHSAIKSVFEQVVIVLGANSDQIMSLIGNTRSLIAYNKDWNEGMASSIRCGLSVLTSKFPSMAAAGFMVCDQPFISSFLLNELVSRWNEKDKAIVACKYENTIGTPALFSSHFFPELMQLKGQEGAKKLIMKHPDDVQTMPFPKGDIDIDTMEDYKKLRDDR